ncbi:MAG: hypothetical protein NTW33_11965 [Methanoregula sp.]|nr:hypothetical protein [Methanoregula sp.]
MEPGNTPPQIPHAYFLPGIPGIGIGGVWLAVIIGILVQAALPVGMSGAAGGRRSSCDTVPTFFRA